MLYKEYEPEVLKKLQRAEVEILKDFDALCQNCLLYTSDAADD